MDSRGSFGQIPAFSSTSISRLSYISEPPVFSSISDPKIVVSFKSLLKKDPTTKVRALEELVAHVQTKPNHGEYGGVEDSILEVWVQVYPRISIDNAKRVRELTHTLQLELMKSARRRMEKHIPKFATTWLMGLYDRDRAVARTAHLGLSFFLNTPEKIIQFWTRCQAHILEFASNALQETPDTLSDERSTSAEDAETKYFRVLGASLSMVLGLLQKVQPDDVARLQEKYDTFLSQENVWKCIGMKDVTVRRAVSQLLPLCLDKGIIAAEFQLLRLKPIFLLEGLKSPQGGSAVEFVLALSKLSEVRQDIWLPAEKPSEKKSPFSRLIAFAEKGSQGTSSLFWENLSNLVTHINPLLITSESSSVYLTALLKGMTLRGEPKSHFHASWIFYLKTAKYFLEILREPQSQTCLILSNILPVFSHHLKISPNDNMWTLHANPLQILTSAFILVTSPHLRSLVSDMRQYFVQLADNIVDNLSPQNRLAKECSEDEVAESGGRWFTLVGAIRKAQVTIKDAPDLIEQPSRRIIVECLTILQRRDFERYSAAKILVASGRHTLSLWADEAEAASDPCRFLSTMEDEDITLAILSPSASDLIACVDLMAKLPSEKPNFPGIWSRWIHSVIALPPNESRISALKQLISLPPVVRLAQENIALQDCLKSICMESVRGEQESLDLFEAALSYGILTEDTLSWICHQIVSSWESTNLGSELAINGLDLIATHEPRSLSRADTIHLSVLALLLRIGEISDNDLSARIIRIREALDSQPAGGHSVVKLLMENLEQAGPKSLGIDTLVQQALAGIRTHDLKPEDILPPPHIWSSSLDSAMRQGLNPSLSICSPMKGAYLLPLPPQVRLTHLLRDGDGHSRAARMGLYVSNLLGSEIQPSSLPDEVAVSLLHLLYLTAQVAADQLDLLTEDALWDDLSRNNNFTQASNFVDLSRKIMRQITKADAKGRAGETDQTLTAKIVRKFADDAKSLTSAALYNAKALCELLQSLSLDWTLTGRNLWLQQIDVWNPSSIFLSLAINRGYGDILRESRTVNTLCNRLISDVAVASPEEKDILPKLVLLTSCLDIYLNVDLPVSHSRIVFAVKQITSWLDCPERLNSQISAEICQTLHHLLPRMKDIYGPYWDTTLGFCSFLWSDASSYPLDASISNVYESIKLVIALETLRDSCADLEESLIEFTATKIASFCDLLKIPRDRNTLPQRTLDALLCRQVDTVPTSSAGDVSDLYCLVASTSRDIQRGAFSLLHRIIPERQQKISLEVALEKKDAQLPDELLQMLQDAPTIYMYTDESLGQFPTAIRSFLLSWLLVFDAFSAATAKVRNDYGNQLNAGGYITPFLTLLSDVLGHSAAQALKLETVSLTPPKIRAYDIKQGDTEANEQNMHWLLVHIYYLALKYVPGLFKSWYLNTKSKQTRMAIDAWTCRYISPLVISDTLDDISDWAAAQPKASGSENDLVVRVSKAAAEVTASCEVDDEHAVISIKLPENYPISGVLVEGVQRMIINEKKWQGWLMMIRGVITFSNGSIIDGLVAFRRNIEAVLDGQSECAICYSIISSDKRMPDKRCHTCKNLFHRTCLYKWFLSSSQNTCPLCRNEIDYGTR